MDAPSFPLVTLASVGSLNVDLIAYVPRLPAPGETLLGSSFAMGPGGKGANQVAAAARLSAPGSCAMVGAVGDDLFGADYVRAFARSGVVTDLVAVVAGASTGVAPILVDVRTAENAIVVVPGANDALTSAMAAAGLARLPAVRSVLLQLEVPLDATLAAMRAARGCGAATFFTPAPAPPAGLPDDDFFRLSSVLIPNLGEAAALAGLPRLAEHAPAGAALALAHAAGAALLARGSRAVAVTMGADGVLLLAGGGRSAAVSAPRVARPVDTTGAGDAFSGALAFFCAELRRGRSGGGGTAVDAASANAAVEMEWDCLVEAARRACFVAAFSVTRKGTQSSFPSRSELPPALFEFAFPGAADIPSEV